MLSEVVEIDDFRGTKHVVVGTALDW
jgi:hypothetical protein